MKKVFIKTYGCSFNVADSENMAGLLAESGKYLLVDSEEEADIVIINSCTVKNKAEVKFCGMLGRLRSQKYWQDVFLRQRKISQSSRDIL